MIPGESAKWIPRSYYGTLNIADVYGEMSPMYQVASPLSAGGPNQSYVAPMGSGAQTGVQAAPGGKGPALSLIGLALMLVLLRVAVEMGGET